jgi:membrane-bound ClpP family serine protease
MNACRTRVRTVELQNKYAEKNREMKRNVRKDQRNWTDNLSYQAEEAANKGNLKELLAIARVLSRKQIKGNRTIRNKDGTLQTNTEEQLKSWQEHFSKILNLPLDD